MKVKAFYSVALRCFEAQLFEWFRTIHRTKGVKRLLKDGYCGKLVCMLCFFSYVVSSLFAVVSLFNFCFPTVGLFFFAFASC